jgi:hypothetical protein
MVHSNKGWNLPVYPEPEKTPGKLERTVNKELPVKEGSVCVGTRTVRRCPDSWGRGRTSS